MKDLIDQINTHKYLYLDKLVELNDLELEIWIDEAKTQGNRDDLPENATCYGTMETDESCKKYKIKIDGYIAYVVTNESFAQENEDEEYDGNLFRIYSKSNFLDYASKSMNVGYAEDLFDEKPKHFEIVCLNHVIDIICFEDFSIEEINKN